MGDERSFPTVATILGCPGELSSANGLVATPIGLSGELQPPSLTPLTPAKSPDDTSDIKDPIKRAVIDNLWGKLPTKTTLEKLKCDLCNVECMGSSVFNSHLSGSKHLKKVKEEEMKKEYISIPYMKYYEKTGSYSCTLCNATLNAFSQIAAHIEGNKHKSKMESKNKLTTSNSHINHNTGKPRVDATPNLLFCATCNVHLNSARQLEQHTASRRHVNRVNGVTPKPRPSPYNRNGKSRWSSNSNYNTNDNFISGGQDY